MSSDSRKLPVATLADSSQNENQNLVSKVDKISKMLSAHQGHRHPASVTLGVKSAHDKVYDNHNQMDEILRLRETNIESIERLHSSIPNKGENFLQHLDLSNMNEMYFENTLAQTLNSVRPPSDVQDFSKMPSINFSAELGQGNAVVIYNSRDVMGDNFVLQRPRFFKFIT